MYSQNNEEKIILDYFNTSQKFELGTRGTFLDCGANDGITLSNTRALVELGWRGVLVEPSPKAYAQLKENCKNFPGVYTYPYALGITNDKVKMWDSGTHLNKDDHGLLSTLSESDYDKWKAFTKYEVIEVDCFRWKTFLNRLTIKVFDFISIDIEGMDYAVLEQIDLRNTSCVCVEWNGKDKAKFVALMVGFNLIHENNENLIFAR